MIKISGKAPAPSIPKINPPSFFDQQSRHRKQAKGWAVLTGVVGCLSALTFGFVVVGALVWYVDFLSRLLPYRLTQAYAYVMDHAGGIYGISAAAVLFTAGLWRFVHRIFVWDTSAGLVWRIGARLPDTNELREEQLVSLTEEIAGAAATPMPAVLLYDGIDINAAAIGDRPEGAGILVSRELLNVLDPDEKQAVIAHLMASAVNGDLQLLGSLVRTLSMVGIAITLLDLPFSPRSRKAIALLWRYSRQPDQESAAALSEEVGPAITRALQPDGLDSFTTVMRKLIGEETDFRSLLGIVLLLPLFPILIMRLAAGMIYGLASLLVAGPLVALVLRSRRRLADATAVQLTRNPAALARALIHLYGEVHVNPQAGWSEMNFVVGHEAANARPFDRLKARIVEATATANNFNRRLGDNTRAAAVLSLTAASADAVASLNFVFGFHPPLHTRIQQLKKMGAEIAWSDRRDYSSWIIAAVLAVAVGGVVILAVP